MNSVNNLILKLAVLFCFVCFFGSVSLWSQNGQVPALVDVQYANQLLNVEIQLIDKQIKEIEGTGGTVDPELRSKFQLFNSVNEVLARNDKGITTFSAIAGYSNYKGFKMDDEAFQDLLDGIWDANFVDLIQILKK